MIENNWLGGLDSNQDSQSQSLESYQLDDLPAGRNKKESREARISRQLRFNHSNLIGNAWGVNRVRRFGGTDSREIAEPRLVRRDRGKDGHGREFVPTMPDDVHVPQRAQAANLSNREAS
jgi:hypothetical protein